LNGFECSVELNERRRTDNEPKRINSSRKNWHDKRRRSGRGLKRRNSGWRQRRRS
jgi:hypothetical protein